MRSCARWGMLTAALILAAPSAHATDDKANREAEARYKEGLARVKSKDYEAARLSFAQAYAVLHRPLILWNLALAEEKSNHPLDALVHFRQVTREAASDADRANAERHVDGLLSQVARIDVQASPGTALVLDGGDAALTAPLADPLDVMPGHHVLAARSASGVVKTNDIDAVAGQVSHVTFGPEIAAPSAAAAPVPASSAVPGAVAVVSPAPAEAQPSAPPADQSPTSFWTARTTTAVVLTGAAVVVVGVGAAFGISSQNNKSSVERYQSLYGPSGCTGTSIPADCTTWNNALNAQNRDADISDALYFTAGALAVGALVSWFFWPKPGHAKTAWVMPELGRGTAGAEVGGRF